MTAVVYRQRVFFERFGFKVYAHHLDDYMLRYLVIVPGFGMLRLHRILRSDNQRGDCHDHPFDFTSFLLTGGYREVCRGPDGDVEKDWPRWSIVRKKAPDAHRLIVARPLWTLVWTGPRYRDWGFHTDTGWVPWREYEEPA